MFIPLIFSIVLIVGSPKFVQSGDHREVKFQSV
jgi:hypothetical protein